jgi:hypothetical protein
LQAIEAHTGVKMQELKLKDDDVLSLLKDVGAAKRKVHIAQHIAPLAFAPHSCITGVVHEAAEGLQERGERCEEKER